MKYLKIILLGLAASLILSPAALAQKKGSRLENVGTRSYFDQYNYEVETVGVGTEGTKALKVWTYGKTVEKAVMDAKKCAVAACIYRGLPASTLSIFLALGYISITDFFNDFFKDGGEYLNYVNLTSDGDPSGQDRLKMKGGYKVGVYVQVLYDRLRKHLEAKGVIKSMDSWF